MNLLEKSKKIENYLIYLGLKSIEKIKSYKSINSKLKKDGTLVTEADLEVNNMICNCLYEINRDIPIISEEDSFDLGLFKKNYFWLIDPIDGTKNYADGGNQYTVNIALIKNGYPVVGMICNPPTGKIWFANPKKAVLLMPNGQKKNLKNKKVNWTNPIILSSKNINNSDDRFLGFSKKPKKLYVSSSLKFCYLAEGKANIYFRKQKLNKWDIAAGHAILEASGGLVTTLTDEKIFYNSSNIKTERFIAAASKNWKKFCS